MGERSPSPPSSISSSRLRAESASAHPLLAGEALSPALSNSSSLKYKPRQRAEAQTTYSLAPPSASSALPASTSVNAPDSPEVAPSSQAAWKLQQQSLQAVVQSELGLSNASAGWAILHKLVNETVSRQSDRLWADLVLALSSGKVALMLPREELPTSDTITAGFLADHCVLLDTSKPENSVATLSGLRGNLSSEMDTLIFSSLVPIPNESERPTLFASDAVQRTLLGEPVRKPDIALPQRATKYTTFAVSSNSAVLSIPQQGRPRHVSNPSTTSKLASLFGKPLVLPTNSPPKVHIEVDKALSGPLSVTAFAIDRCIKRPDVAKGISRAAEARMRILFGGRWPRANSGARKGMWDDIVDRCVNVLNAFQPPKLSNWSASDAKGKASLYHAGPETVAAALQDLYEQVTGILSRPIPRRRSSMPSPPEESETSEAHDRISEEEADTVLEAVEDIITTELYDRLFCPSSSQDAIDDENLAARIAGLNLLEISLDHLGLALESPSGEADEVREKIREGLAALVAACGLELRRLQDSINASPRQKLQVLVAAHKLIVDRIALLPPIPQKEEQASITVQDKREIELDDHLPAIGDATPRAPTHLGKHNGVDLPNIQLPESVMNGHALADEQKAATRSTSSADVILPILIWCILQANPHRLVSDLLYIERFHAGGLLKGESGYCLVNFQAVLEFLLHVDLAALGLGAESERLLGGAPLLTPAQVQDAGSLRIARERVSSEVASLALAAGKGLVGLGGAVEDGYRMLGGLLARSTASLDAARKPEAVQGVKSVLENVSPSTSPTTPLARQSLLRRASSPLFGQSAEAALARNRSKSDAPQREMQEVSPGPASVEPGSSPILPNMDLETRSTRSFSSLLSSADRPSLGDRLVSLARFATPDKSGTPSKPSSRPPSVLGANVRAVELTPNLSEGLEMPPNERFMTCAEAGDLRLGEVTLLLADYRRLAYALASRGLFATGEDKS